MPANRSDTGGKEESEGPERPALAEAWARVMPRYVRKRPGMYKFRVRDRHNPLPHIALSTTAPKSEYRKTASMATDLATELRELQTHGGVEWQRPGSPRYAFWYSHIA